MTGVAADTIEHDGHLLVTEGAAHLAGPSVLEVVDGDIGAVRTYPVDLLDASSRTDDGRPFVTAA